MDRLLILSVISGMVYFIQIYRSAELRCQIQIVAYKKQGGVLLPALFHQHIQKRDAPIVIQSRGRLIGHYKFRSADQCPGCSNALLLTDGELTYLFAPAVLRQIKFAQQLLHPLFNRALFVLFAAGTEQAGQKHILLNGKIGDQVELLEDEADMADPVQITTVSGKIADGYVPDPDAAAAGGKDPCNKIKQS